MGKRWFAMLGAFALSGITLLVSVCLIGRAASMDGDPTVMEVAPSTIINDCDTPIVITGTDFAAVLSGTVVITPPAVYLDSKSLGGAGWVSTGTLAATVPRGFSAGVYTLTVTNPDGKSGSLSNGLTVQNPTPVLQGVTPESAFYGEEATLVITGAHFVPTPTIALDETPCPSVGYVNSATLTATVSSDLLPGVYDLSVRNPGPGDPQGILTDVFTLYSPTPTVTAVHPNAGANDLDIQLIITGTGFAPTPTVTLEEVALGQVTWISQTRLTALVPWGMDEGTYSLTVTNPSPGAASGMLHDAFTVTQGIGVWNAGELYGGWGLEVRVNPITPTTIYALTTVGLFRSSDSGGNWSYVLTAKGEGGVVLDSHTNRLYVGGGVPFGGRMTKGTIGRSCRSSSLSPKQNPLGAAGICDRTSIPATRPCTRSPAADVGQAVWSNQRITGRRGHR
jgi:hypothetical protein